MVVFFEVVWWWDDLQREQGFHLFSHSKDLQFHTRLMKETN